jgi:PiT family inorganic phosphate transporter
VAEVAVALALVFALTNGFLDSGNAVATLVAVRTSPPGPALVFGAALTFVGAVVIGTAVATTVAGNVDLERTHAASVLAAGSTGAIVWNLAAWRLGFPSSGGHALVGGLVGGGLADAGLHAVRWGGLSGWRPVGVFGVLISLAAASILGLAAASAADAALRRAGRRATRRARRPVRAGHWVAAGALALGQGANDAQKSRGVAAAALLAGGHTTTLSVPFWAQASCGSLLAFGTCTGGWRVIRTVAVGIARMRPLDAFAADSAAATVVLVSSAAGAPVSTSQVRAASVVGAAAGAGRRRHIRPAVVRGIAVAWLTTIPGSAVLAAASLPLWRLLG